MHTYTAHCMNGVFQRDKIVTVDKRLQKIVRIKTALNDRKTIRI